MHPTAKNFRNIVIKKMVAINYKIIFNNYRISAF